MSCSTEASGLPESSKFFSGSVLLWWVPQESRSGNVLGGHLWTRLSTHFSGSLSWFDVLNNSELPTFVFVPFLFQHDDTPVHKVLTSIRTHLEKEQKQARPDHHPASVLDLTEAHVAEKDLQQEPWNLWDNVSGTTTLSFCQKIRPMTAQQVIHPFRQVLERFMMMSQ